MEFTTVLFYIFALLLTLSGLKVITSRNPVASALFLVLAFFNAAAIWMLLEAEFLAILLVLVYVGAVMVLFLFVVMMLDINIDVLSRDFKRFIPVATIVGAIITPSGKLRMKPARSVAKSMSSIITTNRNSTATAPT